MNLKESLQSKYAEVIQEVGAKHAAADAARIKQIITLCNELLAPPANNGSVDEAQESTRVTEAIKECDACIAWLKEQAVTKTEDGAEYPATAYAYVPDDKKAGTWKLRLWESLDKKITKTQLNKAAAFLSPGGFRGQKVDITESDLSAVKRTIRSEYKKLKVSDDDIPKWVKESESRQLLSDYTPLTEATISKNGEGLLTIIKPGFNAGKGRYYPKEVIARDYGIFEGAKMYANHPTPTEEKERPERDIRDWVATLGKPFINALGEAQSKFTVVEPWFEAKLALLRDKSMLKEMGVSINAIGSASEQTIEGVKTKLIERLIRARSVDFVTEPGAGGTVNVYESVDPNVDIDLIDITQIKEKRPDIVRFIESEIEAKNKPEVTRKMELTEEVKALKESNEALIKANKELEDKIAEAVKVKAKAEAQVLIKESVAKATLPETAKAKLLDQFKEATTVDGLDVAIKAETEYVAKLTEAGKPRGMGEHTPQQAEDTHKALRESFKSMHPNWTDKQLDLAVNGRLN